MKNTLATTALLLLLLQQTVCAQVYSIFSFNEELNGNKTALQELVKGSLSMRRISDLMGWHIIKRREGPRAFSQLTQSVSFTKQEFRYSGYKHKRKLLKMVKAAMPNLTYSSNEKTWLLTPFKDRDVNYLALVDTAYPRYYKLETDTQLLRLEGLNRAKADSLLRNKDPYIFVLLCNSMFAKKAYSKIEEQTRDLIKRLSHVDVWVENSHNQLVYCFYCSHGSDYDIGTANYLTYWATNYKNYVWSDEKGLFINPENK